MKYFDLKHLSKACKAAKINLSPVRAYFWHWVLAMEEAIFLFALMIGSVIHAFFPWVLNFKLLEWRINRLKVLKQKLPDDELIKKVTFND
jgi:hypothetical protein